MTLGLRFATQMSGQICFPGTRLGFAVHLAGTKMTCSQTLAQRCVCAYDLSIFVRGDAQRTIEPGKAQLYSTPSATRDSKSSALSEMPGRVPAIVAELTSLGGEVLTAESIRAPLTWSTQSVRMQEEHAHDKVSGLHASRSRGATFCKISTGWYRSLRV